MNTHYTAYRVIKKLLPQALCLLTSSSSVVTFRGCRVENVPQLYFFLLL